MATRSGRHYKSSMADGGESTGRTETPSTEEPGRNLEDMMRLLMEDRRQREKEIADDRRKREEEFAEERRLMREQIDALKALVERPASSRGTGEVKDSLKSVTTTTSRHILPHSSA